ncbi:MAG: hypothetical protein ABIQ98_00740 [Sphingomicrobium sp.]
MGLKERALSNQPDRHAAAKALWLAELGEALDTAQRLTRALCGLRSDSQEAVLLRVRIMGARSEVEALRIAARAELADTSPEADPLWSPGPHHDQTP